MVTRGVPLPDARRYGRVGRLALRDEPFCFWHTPEREEEAAEARRLGGLRRRKKRTLAALYELRRPALDRGPSSALLEIALFETLGLENSIARSRVLIAAVVAAAPSSWRLGELDERLAALEAVHRRRGRRADAVFPEEPA